MEALVEIAEESKVDPWVLGGQFASAALPAIFREDDALLEVKLSQETQRDLNDLLGSLPSEVFTADDSLGWVYQFWQSEEKDRVNASGDKIDGRSIPAVTQLFTEHYMVLFLLHNTLGAWHASKVLAKNPKLAIGAKDEAELRRAVALENRRWDTSSSICDLFEKVVRRQMMMGHRTAHGVRWAEPTKIGLRLPPNSKYSIPLAAAGTFWWLRSNY